MTIPLKADGRPELDDVSRNAISPTVAAPSARDIPGDAQIDAGDPSDATDAYDVPTAEESLWFALCVAPDDGTDIAELMRTSGMSRPTVYRHLNQLARDGRAIQVGWGRWRAVTLGEGDDE